MDNLSTVHQALNDSIHEDSKPGSPTSFRLEDDVKHAVNDICKRHGTKLSAFLRQCCLAIKKDYETSNTPSEE